MPSITLKYGRDKKISLFIESLFFPEITIKNNAISGTFAALLDLNVFLPTQSEADPNVTEEESHNILRINTDVHFTLDVS